MGCASSKLDDLEAVALCKDRVQLLSDAIHYRYALADAHDAYIHSLRSIGISLHRFFLAADGVASSSPVLTLPPTRKGKDLGPAPAPSPAPPPPPIVLPSATPAVTHQHSRSSSGSHIHFHSSDDDNDDGHLHSDHSSSLHSDYDLDSIEQATTTTTTFFNFAKKGPPASSVTYEQPPPFTSNNGPVYQGGVFGVDPSSSSSAYPYYYPDAYTNMTQNYYGGGIEGGISAYPYPYAYPQAYGGMGGGFFGSSSPPAPAAPSSTRPPPPPPSPPRASNWDFLNPFDMYENYYNQQSYTPSRSSKELREEEGIPDLEDEEQEVVKEAYTDDKSAASSMAAPSSAPDGSEMHTSSKGAGMEDECRRNIEEEMHYQPRATGAVVEDIPVTNKNIGDEVQQRSEEGMRRKVVRGSRPVPDAMQEVRTQFDRASHSCGEFSTILEVGKPRYHRRKYEVVSTRMMYAITPSLSKTASSQFFTSKKGSESDNVSTVFFEFEEEKRSKAGNLSSTLQKLYIWEKKLLEEVRAEEEMRVCHERKCKRLKRLDEKGAEAYKIDSTRALVKKLSTKIRVSIQVVNSISNRISKLRDEELWPQLNEFILGLVVMWRVTTECLRSQREAVIAAQNLDSVAEAFTGKGSDEHMDATLQLALELLNWIETFSYWTDTQRCFVKALNGWLIKCLHYEPEETADGIAPFSPGRLGAPLVFVICNSWCQATDRISEMEVIHAMKSFARSVLQVWKQHCTMRRHMIRANQDMVQRLKALDRDDQKLRKAVDAVNKRQAQLSHQSGLPNHGEIVLIPDSSERERVSLQSDLQHIFEAMERFAESSMKAYEELRILCEEEAARENSRAS